MTEGTTLLTRRRDKARRVLIIVENLPVPFDRRVWMEATTLQAAGYQVSIICPVGKGFESRRETIDGIHIYRHPLPGEGNGLFGYIAEYGAALFWELWLALRIALTRGFDVIHACNPPDLIFLFAAIFRLFGKRFLFDHHDLCPELFETKFGNRGAQYKAMVLAERLTFGLASVSIATNESYRQIAIERGHMPPDRVFVVRSGPNLDKVKPGPAVPALKQGKLLLIGYVGVIGRQEGLDLLVEAAAWLRAQGRDDLHYGIVGGGPELEAIKAYAIEKGVADLFTFTGRAPDALLMDMLNTADICVNPDRVDPMNDLSTMNKIMEYMALGKPIVQFEVKEGRFSAQDSSLYAAPNDPLDFARKIAELADDPAKRATMGAFGFRRVHDHLGWEHERPRLLAAYDMLFERAG
jgi:glycosyltransferase involved in cell wall biosynthesis